MPSRVLPRLCCCYGTTDGTLSSNLADPNMTCCYLCSDDPNISQITDDGMRFMYRDEYGLHAVNDNQHKQIGTSCIVFGFCLYVCEDKLDIIPPHNLCYTRNSDNNLFSYHVHIFIGGHDFALRH